MRIRLPVKSTITFGEMGIASPTFLVLFFLLFSLELTAQQFVNGKLIRTQKSSITQEVYHKIPKYINNEGLTPLIFNKNLKVVGLDSLRHNFCTRFGIYPNAISPGGEYTSDSSSAVDIGFNGHNKSDFGFSLKLNSPLLVDSLYELNFLITQYGFNNKQEFFNKKKYPYEDFKIYITQSASSFQQEDTIAIIDRKDVKEIDSITVFPAKSRLGTLDDYYFKVTKKFKGKNNGRYITVKAKWNQTDSVYRISPYSPSRIPSNSLFYTDALYLNFGLVATYFHLKCPFEILESGELCDISNPAILSSSSKHATDRFLWSNGDTTATLRIIKPGVYWLEKNRNGCVFRDTIVIDSSSVTLTNHFQLDKCVDSMLILGNFDIDRTNTIWNQNDTNQTIKVSLPGNYIRQSNMNGCKHVDTFKISEYPKHKAIDQLRYTICKGDSIVLKSNVNEAEWFLKNQLIGTNSNLDFLGKENDTLILKSLVNCWQVDTVIIVVKDCSLNLEDFIFVPNAFTPNNDGKNEVFKIEGLNITNVKMEIYNRWGEKILSESGNHVGWDGKFKNQDVPEGVYVAILEVSYIDSNGIEKMKFINQSIQLLR
jgi:gliding motility-associated-like protein